MRDLKVPPHNLEAEMSVLGAILQSHEAFLKCNELLRPEHFYRDNHAKIFAAVQDLYSRNDPVDLITITNELRRNNELEEIGSSAFLASLVEAVPTAANVAYHARIILEKAEARSVATRALQLSEAAYADNGWKEKLLELSRLNASSLIETGRGDAPILVRLSDVDPEPVSWLWPGRIPRRKLSLIIGDPGQGKSMLTLDLAARTTRGDLWPDGAVALRGDVVLLTAEDGLSDTVRPRLDAMRGDPNRVVILTGVRCGRASEPRLFRLTSDLPQLEQAITTSRASLVIIDPVSAYLDKTDSNRDANVRGVLAPLAALAEKTGVGVLGIMHLTKDEQRRVLYRTQGSLGFVAAARAVFAVAADQEDPGRRLFLPIKLNLGPAPTSLAFRINGPSITWESDPVDVQIESVFAPTCPSEENAERQSAAEMLRELLAGGPVWSVEVKRTAREAGISDRTLFRAKRAIGVKAYKVGGLGKGAHWEWSLPVPKAAKTAKNTIGENLAPLAALDGIGSLSKLEEVDL